MLHHILTFFCKPGTKELHKEKLILSTFLLILLIGGLIYGSSRRKALAAERYTHERYSIGITINQFKNFKSPNPKVKYKFTVNLIEFVKFEEIPNYLHNKITVHGGRYYAQFSNIDPNNCQLLLEYPVPDLIKDCPQEGWQFMPGYKHQPWFLSSVGKLDDYSSVGKNFPSQTLVPDSSILYV